MACKYKYNNNWYSKEELQSILYKERGIDKYGKLVKPEIKKAERKQVGYSLILDFNDGEISVIKEFKNKEDADKALLEERKKQTQEDINRGYEIKVLPKIEQGIQPTQTNETLKESIESVKNKIVRNKDKYAIQQHGEKFVIYNLEEQDAVDVFDSKESALQEINKLNNQIGLKEKEYTERALINARVAKLKEVAKKYPRSLIRSEVRPINSSSNLGFAKDELPFQKISDNTFQQFQQSLNTPNTNPILQGNREEQLKKFAELQERLNNKEFLEGAKNAYESSKGLQEWGTQEQYNDYIARVSLGITKNPSSGKYNYTSKVRDIVYHGTNEEKFDEFSNINEGKYTNDFDKGKGHWFLTHFNDTSYYGKNKISALINLLNPRNATTDYDHKGDYNNSVVTIHEPTAERNLALENNNDGAIIDTLEGETRERQIVVFEPKQIHILGSKQDIEGFKEFVSGQGNITQERLNQIQDIFNENPKLTSIGTPEQYSQYLDTIFPDSEVSEMDNSLYISVLNQLEQENEIEKDCSGGKLKAKDGIRGKFTKGSQWEIVKDLKGYPSHSQGGVDVKIGKNGFSFTRDNSVIEAKNGLVLPNKFENPIEFEAISKVLSQRNKHLNWVDRGLNPDKYPKIDNQYGTFSTHRLAYSTGDNGEAYVYPTIIQNDKGELEQLDDNAAWEYAKKTKTAMRIPNVKLAEYYSKNGLIKH